MIVDHAIAYVKKNYSRPADEVARLELLKEHFTGTPHAIKPKEIKRVLNALTAEKNCSGTSDSP